MLSKQHSESSLGEIIPQTELVYRLSRYALHICWKWRSGYSIPSPNVVLESHLLLESPSRKERKRKGGRERKKGKEEERKEGRKGGRKERRKKDNVIIKPKPDLIVDGNEMTATPPETVSARKDFFFCVFLQLKQNFRV
jgi:hypothetical protein